MTTRKIATRRTFIRAAGVALSAPLAVAATSAPARADEPEPADARLARLEDVEAIRALNREFARRVNGGADDVAALFAEPSSAVVERDIAHLAADDFGERDVIDVAPDRQTATGWLHCTVDVERAIGPDCPLVDMARQQGGGVWRRTERAVFQTAYVRRDGAWRIQTGAFVRS